MHYTRSIITLGLVCVGIGIIGLLIFLPLPTYEISILNFGAEDEAETQIVFGGDIMFDRYVRQVMERVGGDYIFSCVDHVLLSADAVVANLEGPITREASVTSADQDAPGHYTFTFAPEVASLLARHNIFIVNIGNNHSLNFGEDGLMQTKQFLTQSDVAYFDTDIPLELTLEEIPFTFINYNQFSSDAEIMIYHNLRAIEEAKEKGRVPVVYAHWGEEYSPVTERQRELAHQFVDAGAAIVIGSHPHVVQEVERYNGVYIYYSLGNFIFDQYFSDAVINGLLISVLFNKDGVKSIQEIPIQLHSDGRTCVSDPIEK